MARAVDENAHISEESAQLLLSEESGEEERLAWRAISLPALERVTAPEEVFAHGVFYEITCCPTLTGLDISGYNQLSDNLPKGKSK